METLQKLPVKVEIAVLVYEVKGGFRGEVPRFPGCLAHGTSLDELTVNLGLAIQDWLAETPEKTEEEAWRLAAIQGSDTIAEGPYPVPYPYSPPASWSEDDDD